MVFSYLQYLVDAEAFELRRNIRRVLAAHLGRSQK